MELLRPWIDQGVANVEMEADLFPADRVTWYLTHPEMLTHCAWIETGHAKWMLSLELDEYTYVPDAAADFGPELDRCSEGHAGISVDRFLTGGDPNPSVLDISRWTWVDVVHRDLMKALFRPEHARYHHFHSVLMRYPNYSVLPSPGKFNLSKPMIFHFRNFYKPIQRMSQHTSNVTVLSDRYAGELTRRLNRLGIVWDDPGALF